MAQPEASPDNTLFRASAPPMKLAYWIIGAAVAAAPVYLKVVEGDWLIQALVAANTALGVACLCWVFAWAGNRDFYWIIEDDHLVLWKGKPEAELRFSNIISADYFGGEGFGLRLEDEEEFFQSFQSASLAKSWRKMESTRRKDLEVNVLLPAWMIGSRPKRFTEAIKAQVSAAPAYIPKPRPAVAALLSSAPPPPPLKPLPPMGNAPPPPPLRGLPDLNQK